MAKLSDIVGAAVKAANSIITGSAPILSGDRSGSTELAVYDPITAQNLIDGMSVGDLYATQPNLRTVVSFVARNAAQLGRHVYTKAANGDRKRATTGSAVKLLANPNEYMSGYDLFNMLFTELALYDFALWVPRMNDAGDWMVDPIPTEWIVGVQSADAFRAEKYKIQRPGASSWYYVLAKDAVVFRGYSPHGFKRGSSTVEALRDTLSEQVSAMTFRKQMWQRGGRVGMFMTRPADAPEWSAEAKEKFVQKWKASWSGTGANAGSTPLLEDGMELKRVGFNAKEEQWLEAATLALATVAGAYHVPPSMVGASGSSSTFASVHEFRKMLYTETLGPLLAQVEDTFNTFLMPLIDAPAGQYLELNIAEKLQGDFQEQGEMLFKATGGPYMTVNEARSRMNLPAIDGGDELLAPLNMGAAGNNGPAADVPIPDPGAEPTDPAAPKGQGVKAPANRAADHQLDALSLSLADFFSRQKRATLSALGVKAEGDWWDQKTWNAELAAILQPHMRTISAGVARRAASAKGLDPDAYSVAQTAAFLKSVAESRADAINATTRDRVQEALDSGEPVADAVGHVFTEAIETRAPSGAKTLGTMLAAWAVVEAAQQLVPPSKEPTKTWISSGLPDSRHSSMNGQTVKLSENFSNGAKWPGDPVLGAKGVSNCACGVEFNY